MCVHFSNSWIKCQILPKYPFHIARCPSGPLIMVEDQCADYCRLFETSAGEALFCGQPVREVPFSGHGQCERHCFLQRPVRETIRLSVLTRGLGPWNSLSFLMPFRRARRFPCFPLFPLPMAYVRASRNTDESRCNATMISGFFNG